MSVPATIAFADSPRSTVGIEWEIALVDRDSGDLRQTAAAVLDRLRGPDGRPGPRIRGEYLLNTVELVTDPHPTVAAAAHDLEQDLARVRAACDALRVDLMCAGTHPFARPEAQRVAAKARYQKVVDRAQWWGRQMLIYGVHTHIGIEDRTKVLPILRALLTYVPHLQALSAASPFWAGEATGYASNRALVFQQLPTAGLPFPFATWQDMEACVGGLLHTGVIDDFTELRWDIRPSPQFGTIEVRVCDGLPTLLEVKALTALIQCLVEDLSTRLDAGQTLPEMPTWFVQENKWRAARYGMDAIIILNAAGDEQLITEALPPLLEHLAPVAARLGCEAELGGIREILHHGASYQRQRAAARRNGGDLRAVVDSLVAEMRAGAPL
jgi:carboxylate-amine ligase